MTIFDTRVLHCRGVFTMAMFFSLHASAGAVTAPPPIESFFKNAQTSDAIMSPDGRAVALRVASAGGRAKLAVLDLETMKVAPVAAFDDSDIATFSWVNPQRLIFSVTDLQSAAAERAKARQTGGLFAVNRDGSVFKQLVERSYHVMKNGDSGREALPPNTFFLQTVGTKDSDDVLVSEPHAFDKSGRAWDYVALQRLNTRTGRATDIDVPLHSQSWLFDAQGAPRIAVTYQNGRTSVKYLDDGSHQWRQLIVFDSLREAGFEPLWFDVDGSLYVRAANGHDKAAVYRYDLSKNQISAAPLVASADFDMDGHVVAAAGKMLGYRYDIDAEVTQWFDAEMKAIQQTVDALLPNTINRISRGARSDTPFVLINAYADIQPSLYLLFNTQTKKLIKLGASHPDIDSQQMAPKDMKRLTSRDGLVIPVYLTLPKFSPHKNLPMVVLVHGGPYERGGKWAWDADAQFLASRGYAVLEPEFRGSTGFGSKHFVAGWKQWGLPMQNDIADSAKWAIAQGIADPQRICIAGASYGGYAALMGLINDPELFRCGVDWVGVTDIGLMYSLGWSDLTDAEKRYGMPLLVGDPVKDAVQLRATSPLHNAARIKRPLLMAYGGADQRVPIEHGMRLRDAVKAGNPDVEWVEYEQEGHGWQLESTRVDFWRRVEKFLSRSLGAQ